MFRPSPSHSCAMQTRPNDERTARRWDKAYGARGLPFLVPGKTPLTFDLTLVAFK